MQNEEQSLPLGSALFGFGNGSPHILEGGPSSSAIVPTTVVAEDKTADGFACLLASFLDEDMPLSNENKLDQVPFCQVHFFIHFPLRLTSLAPRAENVIKM